MGNAMTADEALTTIPHKIKVGPHTYTVWIVDSISCDSDARASVDPEKLSIEIVSTMASSSAVVGACIHELLHAIWADRDLGKRVDEEKMVLQYESGLVQLFQDNPKLLTWIRRGLK